jgi:hypothetical protein
MKQINNSATDERPWQAQEMMDESQSNLVVQRGICGSFHIMSLSEQNL